MLVNYFRNKDFPLFEEYFALRNMGVFHKHRNKLYSTTKYILKMVDGFAMFVPMESYRE